MEVLSHSTFDGHLEWKKAANNSFIHLVFLCRLVDYFDDKPIGGKWLIHRKKIFGANVSTQNHSVCVVHW